MESFGAAIRYVISGVVKRVEERFYDKWTGGVGAEAKHESISLGWYVTFLGSWEALYFGPNKPELASGDRVTITFERTNNAKPRQASIE